MAHIYSRSFYPIHHVWLTSKNYKVYKRQKTQSEVTKQTSQSEMAQMWELSDQDLKTTMSNVGFPGGSDGCDG